MIILLTDDTILQLREAGIPVEVLSKVQDIEMYSECEIDPNHYEMLLIYKQFPHMSLKEFLEKMTRK